MEGSGRKWKMGGREGKARPRHRHTPYHPSASLNASNLTGAVQTGRHQLRDDRQGSEVLPGGGAVLVLYCDARREGENMVLAISMAH